MECYICLLFVSVCVVGMSAAPSGSGQFDRLGVGLRVDMRARHCSVVGFLPDPLNLPLGTMGTWFFFMALLVVGVVFVLHAATSREKLPMCVPRSLSTIKNRVLGGLVSQCLLTNEVP